MALVRRDPGQSPEEFWAEVERTRGERVIRYGLGQYLTGWSELAGPCWGVVYLTESSICFRTFPQRNWLSSILGGAGRGSGRDTEQEICTPLHSISNARLEDRGTWLQRFVRPRLPTLRFEQPAVDGTVSTVRIELEQDADAFLADLLRTE